MKNLIKMNKKLIFIISIIFFVASCNTMDSVKRGLTGEKRKSMDEFLVKKKDPLVLPPDYENLPTPENRTEAAEEASEFEKSLKSTIEIDENSSTSSSTENSILRKIKSK